MNMQDFDEQFRVLYTGMVEIAYEYVGNNRDEVNGIYILGSMEGGDFFYNVFYKINGNVVAKHKINTVSKQQCDVSLERQHRLSTIGIEYLEKTAALFKADDREIPTLMKMIYNPQTGEFDNEITYEKYYTNDPEKIAVDVCNEWFEEMKRPQADSFSDKFQ